NIRKEKTRCSDWSNLSPDVLRKILETLSPIDSHQAKAVCSDWFSVWKTCLNRPPCPLRIIHQGGLKESSYCMASSGSWILMVDSRFHFHLLNLLTRKRINLPAIDDWKSYGSFEGPDRLKNSAVLWIDEVKEDYFVAWTFSQHHLFTYKKGDDSWSNVKPRGEGSESVFLDIAYKNSKLYVLTTKQKIKIFDVSKEGNPREEKKKNPYRKHPFRFDEKPREFVWKRKIAIQRSGEVLIILSLKEKKYDEEKLLFYVFKMNRESCEWERVDSIGDGEMVVFGHGVTLRAPVECCFTEGIKSDSICFVEDDVWPDNQDHEDRASDCGVFDMATGRIEWPKKSCFYINEAQWFVPGVDYDYSRLF
ncbi:hypothetical protein EUTSA_v10002155mg, partial [Eutrema salsugineum]